MKKAVIIIPTYNEKGNIDKLITTLEEKVFPKITNYEMSILVADDNSPDGTADVVKKSMRKWKNIEISSGEKHGLGAAYIRGMSYAIDKMHAEILFEMDGDFFHDPNKVPEFLKKIDEGYDFVIGTRYSDGGAIPKNWGIHRKFMSVVGNFIIRSVFMRFYIHDWTGGYRAIRKEVFLKEKEKLSPFKGYRFQVGFLHKAVQDNFKIAEVPFQATDRVLGRSKIPAAETIIDTLKYVFIARFLELKRFVQFLIVGGTGFAVQILTQELSIITGLAFLIAGGLYPIEFFLTRYRDLASFGNVIAVAIGAESAILSNFTLNNFWTFSDTRKLKEKSPFIIRLFKFNMTSLASIIIQVAAVSIAIHYLGTHIFLPFLNIKFPVRLAILFPTIIFIIIPLNYLIYNKIIWKTQYLQKNISKTNG